MIDSGLRYLSTDVYRRTPFKGEAAAGASS
jgi:hypothetical protein